MKESELEFRKATEALRGSKLSAAEKSAMLSSIYKNEPAAGTGTRPSPFAYSMFFYKHSYLASTAVVVFLLGGTAFASASSLPGDPLYGLKVGMIEPMALALRFDEESKDRYRVALLRERVVEIQELKSQGRLNYDVESISAAVAQENVKDIETSATLENDAVTVEISGQIDTYNSIVEEAHRLETTLRSTSTPERNEEDRGAADRQEERNDDGSGRRLDRLINEVDRTRSGPETVTENIGSIVDSSQPELVEEIENIEGSLKPIIDQIAP